MNNIDLMEKLRKYNFWDKKLLGLGLERSEYLDFLENSLNNNLIKVLTGQRRSGKSYVLKQFCSRLIKSVNPKNILYINFEIQDFQDINSDKELNNLVKVYLKEIKKSKDKCYLLFDEIQEVKNWEKAINSFLADHTFKKEIFITGSNSNLLSSELSTYITGRYIAKNIYPFTYQEYLGLFHFKNTRENFVKFLDGSQLPEIYGITNEDIKHNYIQNLKDSILYKDIAKRYKIENLDLLDKLFLFLIDNGGNLFSLNSIHKKLKSLNIDSSINTLSSYIKYLEESFIISGVYRYDIKGKSILEGNKKYYSNDFGFRKYLFSSYDQSSGKILENYVYNVLKSQGFKVYVGKIGHLEIDFIGEKKDKKIYVQVAYLLNTKSVKEREYGNLESIKDSWPKVVVSMDDWKISSKNGIEHIQSWDFETWIQAM